MTKKQYITPELETIKIAMHQMLAASLPIGEGTIDTDDIGAPVMPGLPGDLPGMTTMPGAPGLPAGIPTFD